MALILDGTDGITSSGGTNVLQDDAVITANIADGAVSDSKIANGAVTAAKLAAGAVPAPTTDQVLSATAGAASGAVGTYAFCRRNPVGGSLSPGGTVSGSNLQYSNSSAGSGSTVGVGTWMLMGQITTANSGPNTSLWLRIS